MLTELEKKIIASLQEDTPVTSRPYKEMADKMGIDESVYLDQLKRLCDSGIIRRFGATLRHQKSGFVANAMLAWQVDEDQVNEAGEKMAAFPEVSHCYRRNPAPEWPYNLYTMVHSTSEAGCRDIARRLSEAVGVDSYKILFSRKELKKTSMVYFPQTVSTPEKK